MFLCWDGDTGLLRISTIWAKILEAARSSIYNTEYSSHNTEIHPASVIQSFTAWMVASYSSKWKICLHLRHFWATGWLYCIVQKEAINLSKKNLAFSTSSQTDSQTDSVWLLSTDTELVWFISLQVSSKRENMRTTQPEGLSCSTEESLMLLSKQRREILVSLPAGLEPAGKLNPLLVLLISQAEKRPGE